VDYTQPNIKTTIKQNFAIFVWSIGILTRLYEQKLSRFWDGWQWRSKVDNFV